MCGIAGLLGWSLDGAQWVATAQRLGKAIHHRGPDDFGSFTDEQAGVLLVSTRLAIMDLSPAGHMPMQTEDGRWSIVFNGEIYNFLELRAELESQGVRFRSHSDTEVILELFRAQGPAFLPRLRGMFAFAIWDARERVAFLARDPLGIKPLYVFERDKRLAFASELRPLLSQPGISRELDPAGLRSYFLRGYVTEPHTLIRDITILEAGMAMEWSPGRGARRWSFADVHDWTLDADRLRGEDAPSAARHVRAALDDSLRHHLISDVPVGIFLSGGLDSTAMLGAMSKIQPGNKIGSFSIGFEMADLNEAPIARRIAAEFNSDHHEQIITGQQALGMFEDYMAALDLPSVDGFNTYCVSRFARENGYKVVLSGLGGDELFGGYPSFQRVPEMMRQRRWIEAVPGADTMLGGLMESYGRTPVQRRIGSFLRKAPNLATAYGYFRGVFSEKESRALCNRFLPGSAEDPGTIVTRPALAPNPKIEASAKERISLFELTQYMRNQLLRDSDVMSMAHSLELRTPFVDSAFVKAVFQLQPEHRFQPRKAMLTQAVPELPDWLLRLPKRGFTLPFQHWINNEWRVPFDDLFRRYPMLRRDQPWSRSLVLYSLEHWIQRHDIAATRTTEAIL